MSWLRSLFAQAETITRLRRERDFHRQNADELAVRLEASEARLKEEINSNRSREDALKDQIVTICGMNALPRRLDIEQSTAIEKREAVGDEPVDLELDAAVEQVVADYVQNAAERGIEYDSISKGILRDRIRLEPQEHGI